MSVSRKALSEMIANSVAVRSLPAERPPITSNPEKLGGTPTIAGTRLPVTALFDHLARGNNLDQFLEEFDGVTRAQLEAVLLKIKETLATGWLAERVDY